MRNLTAWSILLALAGCGGADNGALTDGGPPAQSICDDVNGNPVTCPLPVSGNTCAHGDALACTPLAKTELTVGAKTCLRVVLQNDCAAEAYSQTCIQHTEADGKLAWQCWVSSTPEGATIDVAECDATGQWYHYASLSPGQLDVISQQGLCPS